MNQESKTSASEKMSIEAAFEAGSVKDRLFRGVVVDVRDTSGLIRRCETCNRVFQRGRCRIHGKTKGRRDLRVKCVLDDGTGAVLVVLDREATEPLIGATLADMERYAKEHASDKVAGFLLDLEHDQAVTVERVETQILGKTVDVRGDMTSDEFGFMLFGREARFAVPSEAE